MSDFGKVKLNPQQTIIADHSRDICLEIVGKHGASVDALACATTVFSGVLLAIIPKEMPKEQFDEMIDGLTATMKDSVYEGIQWLGRDKK